ncbi:hypothetical protein M2271_000227 [Streptomyces sp. LBL]|uniref:hypothetical protein n=1 Tax=Streptomyces sp. LBL TaxID=2940562 RepID=UPI0024760EC8|nr:hypothetical protein [Streptomyces sp. LBL]MDH6622440.1 hypothetical protein [Streptomyces sp. LBL]
MKRARARPRPGRDGDGSDGDDGGQDMRGQQELGERFRPVVGTTLQAYRAAFHARTVAVPGPRR